MTADRRPVVSCTSRRSTSRQRTEAAPRGNPSEISEGAWHNAHNRPPLCGWENDANGESFKVPELLESDRATIYVRINDRHFKFDGGIQTSHSDCCRHVAQSKAYREPRTNKPARVFTSADDHSL